MAGGAVSGLATLFIPPLYETRRARQRASGEIYAQRRIEIIERVTVGLSEIVEVTEQMEIGINHHRTRHPSEVLIEFHALLDAAALYLSVDLMKSLRSFSSHLWDLLDSHPGREEVARLASLDEAIQVTSRLAEAIRGKHERS